MQDSLPAAGPALPGGIGYPQGSCERFHGCNDSPFPSFLRDVSMLFRATPSRRPQRPKPLVFASRERGQTLRVRPSCECVAKRFAKHIPGWVEAIRYARMDLSGWPETTSYARPPEATVAMLAMNAGRRLHLRVTLIAHGLLPRVMRSDLRPGCQATLILIPSHLY